MTRGGPSHAALVTLLFTDVVGSTELLQRLGDDGAERVRRAHFKSLRELIAANGGVEVKSLGDGLMTVFDSAADAISAAVAIQRAIASQNRRVDEQLGVRIGLHVGDSIREEDDYFGTPVVIARRLCDSASGGQIIASGLLRQLVGLRGGFEFTDLGELTLKGIVDPVLAVEVAWNSEQPPAPSMPSPLRVDHAVGFIGREAERGKLEATWREASLGRRRVVLLAGEPGIGKTRLATELAFVAHADGATVLFGRCEEDAGLPYQPFVEAFRHYIEVCAPGDLTHQLGRHGGELIRLLPELVDRAPALVSRHSSDADTERHLLFEAVTTFFSDAASANPLVLVLDDLQWASVPALLLLKHIVRASEDVPLLIVGTYRDSDITRSHPLTAVLADLRREHGVVRVPVRGLSSAEVVAYVEAAAGHELDDAGLALAHALRHETDGSPFFVGEVLLHLIESGSVSRQGGRYHFEGSVAELGIPDSVREVIGRRLTRLTPVTNSLLSAASVIGPEFDLSVLAAVAGVSEDSALAGVEEAMNAVICHEVATSAGRFSFSHTLVRHTLYEELTGARRMRLHRRVAAAIEELRSPRLDSYLEELARHWIAATSGGPAIDTEGCAKAAAYSQRAAAAAMASLAYEEAVRHLSNALAVVGLSGSETARCDLLIGLGEAQRCAGEAEHRETLFAAARLAQELGDADRLARAALANHRGMYSLVGTVDDPKVTLLEASLEAIPDGDSIVGAELLATLAAELTFADSVKQRAEVARAAIAMARRVGHNATLAKALIAAYYALWGPAHRDERLNATAELGPLTELLGDPQLGFQAGIARFVVMVEQGDLAEACQALDGCVRLADELRQPTLQWRATYAQATHALIVGRLEEAEQLAGRALDIGQAAGEPDALMFYSALLFFVRYQQGRLEEVVGIVADVATNSPILGWRAMLALTFCELDRASEARSVVAEFGGPGLAAIPRDLIWHIAMSALAEVYAELDLRDEAAQLYDVLLPHRDQTVTTSVYWFAAVEHVLGRLAATLGQLDDADDHFRRARDWHHRMGAVAALARTELAWADLLRRRGGPDDDEQATELLHAAVTGSRELGLATVERRATAALDAFTP